MWIGTVSESILKGANTFVIPRRMSLRPCPVKIDSFTRLSLTPFPNNDQQHLREAMGDEHPGLFLYRWHPTEIDSFR